MAKIIPLYPFMGTIFFLLKRNFIILNSIFIFINSNILKFPTALERRIHREYALISTIHCCPDVHIVGNAKFLIVYAVICKIISNIFACGNRIFASTFFTVKKLEYIAKNSSYISAVNFFNNK